MEDSVSDNQEDLVGEAGSEEGLEEDSNNKVEEKYIHSASEEEHQEEE